MFSAAQESAFIVSDYTFWLDVLSRAEKSGAFDALTKKNIGLRKI